MMREGGILFYFLLPKNSDEVAFYITNMAKKEVRKVIFFVFLEFGIKKER